MRSRWRARCATPSARFCARREAAGEDAADRQSRRDRLPHHPQRQGAGPGDRRGPFGRRCRGAACRAGRRGRAYRPVQAGRELSEDRRDPRRRPAPAGPMRCIPAMASWPRTKASPAPVAEAGPGLGRADAGVDRGDGRQGPRPRPGRGRRGAGAARQPALRRGRAGGHRGGRRRGRLSAAGQGLGRRRRHRHAGGRRAGRSAQGRGVDPGHGGAQLRRRRRCSWSAMSATPGMSRSRCSASATAGRSICSSANARCSAGSRRSWRKAPRPASRRHPGPDDDGGGGAGRGGALSRRRHDRVRGR